MSKKEFTRMMLFVICLLAFVVFWALTERSLREKQGGNYVDPLQNIHDIHRGPTGSRASALPAGTSRR